MMQQVFTYFLEQFGRVFEWLNSIEILYGVTLFQYLIVILIFHIVITLLVPTIKKQGSDRADRSKKGKSDG